MSMSIVISRVLLRNNAVNSSFLVRPCQMASLKAMVGTCASWVNGVVFMMLGLMRAVNRPEADASEPGGQLMYH